MMTEDANYSLEHLAEFLDIAASQGLLNRATAQSRKVAASKVLGVLDEAQQADLRDVNVDEALKRFGNLERGNLKPESLRIYGTRTRSALRDFIAWVDDPVNFKASASPRSTPQATSKKAPRRSGGPRRQQDEQVDNSVQENAPQGPGFRITIPLRMGKQLVEVRNLPTDLTAQDVNRIIAVLNALPNEEPTLPLI